MTSEALKTLFHPFVGGELPLPGKGARALFLGAAPGFRLPEGFDAELHLVQGFRPAFLALNSAGYTAAPLPEGDGYDMALVLAGRHRGENELRIAEAIERVASNGTIVVAGSKDDGIASLRKRLDGLVAIEGALPKYHGLAFWFRRPSDKLEATALRAANPDLLVENRFATAPGMFSHDRIDAGSRLLAANLPKDISGKVADFCAGWGYLAAELARSDAVRAIDLHEADFASIEAAKRNLRDEAERRPVGFHWRDLLGEPVEPRYDAIVMNPPFHRGRAAEPGIGQRLIGVAAKALRRGGRLFMVANRQLPYEETLEAEFAQWREITRDGGFKVLAATR
jgi:16S rRNA (guanine1207-N2)-methyltransferase